MLEYTTNEEYIESFVNYTLFNINETLVEYAQYNFHSYDDFLCAIERAPDMGNCPPSQLPSIQAFTKDRKASIRAQLKVAGWEEPKESNSACAVQYFLPLVILPLLLLL